MEEMISSVSMMVTVELPAVEVEVAAVKGHVARCSVGEVTGPAREVVRLTGQMIPSSEMTEVIWTGEVRASNAGRREMLRGYMRGNTSATAPHVHSAKLMPVEVTAAKVARTRTDMTASANMRGDSDMTASTDMRATTDMASKVATAVSASMSLMILLGQGRRSDEGERGNSAKPEFSYVTHGSPPQSPPACI